MKAILKVLQNGKALPKNKYTWDSKRRIFASQENNLVIQYTGTGCTFDTGAGCTFDTGTGCTFDTGEDCTFKTGSGCTFKTGSGCTFDTGADCTFKTGWGCTFKTGWGCTFDTGTGCTFDTGTGCTFKTGEDCVVIRRDIFEIIQLAKGVIFKLCPNGIKGFLTKKENEDAFYMDIDGQRIEHIIADGILSKVIKKKGNIYHVQNHGTDKTTYLVKDGEIYSHGATLKEAKKSLKYKISSRDTSEFKKYKLNDKLDQKTLIRAYRAITGACEAGTRYFCENNILPQKCTVKKAIELTKGQYGNERFKEFFKE